LRAVTLDLKVFFTVVTRDPVEVAAPDVFEYLAHQRRDRRWCGRPLTLEGLDEFVAGAKRRAGFERCTCHQLRHTCITRLRLAGMALEAVQAQAGHRSIESTRIYLHLTNDWLANEYQLAVQRIDAYSGAEPLAMQDIARALP
jgi:integrase/recombinase XerD